MFENWVSPVSAVIYAIGTFLPLDAGGHLAFLQEKINVAGNLLFPAVLYLGAFLAVVLAYRHDILALLRDMGAVFQTLFPDAQDASALDAEEAYQSMALSPEYRLVFLILVGTVPLFLLFLPLDAFFGSIEGNLWVRGGGFTLTGILMLLAQFSRPRSQKGRRSRGVLASRAKWGDVFLVGLVQVLGVLPGFSRLGASVAVGVLRGFDHRFSLRFSLLLSVPAYLGAGVLSLFGAFGSTQGVTGDMFPTAILGFVLTVLVGYGGIQFSRRLMKKEKFFILGIYPILMGVLVMAVPKLLA